MPCARYLNGPFLFAYLSNVSAKTRPIILRFSSGSETPFKESRNCLDASTNSMGTSRSSLRNLETSSASPSLRRPVSMKTHRSRSCRALLRSTEATDESTPPETAQRIRPSGVRLSSLMVSSRKPSMLHFFSAWQTPLTKLERISAPCSVCTTSGWNWTPNWEPSAERIAAYGELSLVAIAESPRGSLVAESPWLIQHVMLPPSIPLKMLVWSVILTFDFPYSRLGTRLTSPPCAWTRSW